MSGVKEDPQPLSHQNEARPASYQTFDEEPSMISHAAESTLENRYKINPFRKYYHALFLFDLDVILSPLLLWSLDSWALPVFVSVYSTLFVHWIVGMILIGMSRICINIFEC